MEHSWAERLRLTIIAIVSAHLHWFISSKKLVPMLSSRAGSKVKQGYPPIHNCCTGGAYNFAGINLVGLRRRSFIPSAKSPIFRDLPYKST